MSEETQGNTVYLEAVILSDLLSLIKGVEGSDKAAQILQFRLQEIRRLAEVSCIRVFLLSPDDPGDVDEKSAKEYIAEYKKAENDANFLRRALRKAIVDLGIKTSLSVEPVTKTEALSFMRDGIDSKEQLFVQFTRIPNHYAKELDQVWQEKAYIEPGKNYPEDVKAERENNAKYFTALQTFLTQDETIQEVTNSLSELTKRMQQLEMNLAYTVQQLWDMGVLPRPDSAPSKPAAEPVPEVPAEEDPAAEKRVARKARRTAKTKE